MTANTLILLVDSAGTQLACRCCMNCEFALASEPPVTFRLDFLGAPVWESVSVAVEAFHNGAAAAAGFDTAAAHSVAGTAVVAEVGIALGARDDFAAEAVGWTFRKRMERAMCQLLHLQMMSKELFNYRVSVSSEPKIVEYEK